MKIIKIDPFAQTEIVEKIALAYQRSFGGEPWNEGYLCPVCKKVFAFTDRRKICPACAEQSQSVLLVEYWPTNKIISDFYRDMKNPDSVSVVVQTEGQVVGFAWGYRVFVNPDLDLHLEAPDLHKSLHGDFFYLDECGLVPACQGRGIGKLLVGHIFNEQQLGQVLLRTMYGSRMCNLIKSFGGEIIRHISQNRVIMRLKTL